MVESARGSENPVQAKEQEPSSRVSVIFFGHDHTGLNLQSSQRLDDLLSSINPQGKTYIFTEGADKTQSTNAKIRAMRQEHGHEFTEVANMLTIQTGFLPQDYEVRMRRKKINEVGPVKATIQGLAVGNMLSIFAHGQVLDKHVERLSLKYESEVHPPKKLSTLLEGHEQAVKASYKTEEEWFEGNFQNAADAYLDIQEINTHFSTVREADMVEDLKNLTKKLIKDKKDGGTIVITLGISHYPLLMALRQKLGGEKSGVNFQINAPDQWHSPELQIRELLRTGQDVPSELVAQGVLEHTFGSVLQDFVSRKPSAHFQTVADHYEDIMTVAEHIAATTPEPLIRLMCERGANIMDFVRNHPFARDIKEYISD